MHNVDIEIFCIAQTRMNPAETRKWLDHLGATEYPVPETRKYCDRCPEPADYVDGEYICSDTGDPVDKPLAATVTDAGAVCGLCAKRCYMSFEPGLNPNVTRVRKDWYDYLSNILKSKHGSVAEHATWTFAIEGVSRVFTGEMNRHRAGVAISEGSMRYIRMEDIGFWMPLSLREGNRSLMPTARCKACRELDSSRTTETCSQCNGTGRIDLIDEETFETKKQTSREILKQAFTAQENSYAALCETWGIEDLKSFNVKKKLTSLFRRIIGMGVATGGTWTMNTRALRHIMALRTAPGAEEEIAYVMSRIGKYMVESEPALFGDFALVEGCWVPENVKI